MIDIPLIIESLPALLRGAVVSLQIATCASVIGFLFGTVLGIAQTSKRKLLRYFIFGYTSVIRGTPMLIHIFVAIYVLPQLGINLPRLWAVILAIGLNSSAYISYVVRAGINSVSIGQREAAQVLGLSPFQTMRFIILPQAIRTILPALGSELVTLVKDSSLASMVGVIELTQQGRIVISNTYDALSMYCAIACIYFILTSALSLIVNAIETRMAINAPD